MTAQLALARARSIRWLAAAIVLVLSSTGLSLASAALPAQAGGGDPHDSNYYASMTVHQVTASPGPWDSIEYSVTVTPLNGSDCVNAVPTITWTEASGRNAAFLGYAIVDDSLVFSYRFGLLFNGGQLAATVQASGGCVTPDSETPQLEVAVQFTAPYYQNYVYGYAIQGSEGADDWSDPTTRIEGATVSLIETGDEFGTPIYSALTDANGAYTLWAPFNNDADIARTYKIRFTMPDGAVLYFDYAGAPWTTSTSSWAAAAIGGPSDWGNTSYSAFIAFDSGPPAPDASETNYARQCFGAESSSTDFETDTVHWKDLCLTDPTLGQVATIPGDRSAIAGFGMVYLDLPNDEQYYVTADEQTAFNFDGGWYSAIVDRDIYLPGIDRTVYVSVDRGVKGSFMAWSIQVRDSESGDVVDVPIHFLSDSGFSDRTQWVGTDNWRVATDSPDGSGTGAVTIHNVSAASFSWSTGEGASTTTVDANGGSLIYYLGILDYTGCLTSANVAEAAELAQDAVDGFGGALAPLVGGTCETPPPAAADWPLPVVNELRVDAPFDQTFTPPLTGHGWNWTYGAEGEADDLPAGLALELLEQWTDDTAPSFRITGTPTTAGPYDFTLWVADDFGSEVEIHLVGNVLTPAESSEMSLDAQIGDIVAGAEVTFGADGLKEGADYSLVLHSTPVTLAAGSVTVSHSILGTAVIPTGLEAGWHSLTLTSQWFSQSAFDSFHRTIWFRIDASGRLVQFSALAPAAGALAYSGSTDPTGAFLLAAAALVLGFGMVWSRARRRVRIR